ncbi:MAG: hypothetical protein NVSMB62_14440 [Acidobacteriaceae bacterium]
MQVALTPDQKAFAADAVQSGRLGREEDALREALSREERERTRAEILTAVDEAEASLLRGEAHEITRTASPPQGSSFPLNVLHCGISPPSSPV